MYYVVVTELPETNHLFSEIDLNIGQTAYLKCLTNQPENGVHYSVEWLKDEQVLRIDESRMLSLPSGAIEIDEITKSDSGSYQCNVTSGTISK